MELRVFGFQALWSPYFLCILIIVGFLYAQCTGKWRGRFSYSEPLKKSEAMYFYSALLLIYVIKGSPLDVLAHISFTMHMVQMALLLLLVPIFIIKGIPAWLWQIFISHPLVRPIWRIVTQPIVALFTFTLLFSFYHIPVILDAIKLSEALHACYTVVLFGSAITMYWTTINRVPGEQQLKGLHKVAMIIGNAVLITPACALIIFADTPLYNTYQSGEAWLQSMALCVPTTMLVSLANAGITGPELFMSMSTLEDQQLGGIVMKIIQELIFGVLLYTVFRAWYKHEQRNADALTEAALAERKAMNNY
ncbi:MAG: cytochrome c oxidase assembly factor CtaG [Caryophanon sp.]|nr:cytochrome c oxidase assembly factor CtaG [Caryophanon sp.]